MDWVLNFFSPLKKKKKKRSPDLITPLQILLHFHLFFFVNLCNKVNCAVSNSLFPFYPELSFCFQYSQELPVTISLSSVMKSKNHAQSSLSPELCVKSDRVDHYFLLEIFFHLSSRTSLVFLLLHWLFSFSIVRSTSSPDWILEWPKGQSSDVSTVLI